MKYRLIYTHNVLEYHRGIETTYINGGLFNTKEEAIKEEKKLKKELGAIATIIVEEEIENYY